MTHTPTPWQADPDDREGYEWNIHILDESGINRICFMSNGPQTEANAAFIVKAVNNHAALVDLVQALLDNDPDEPIADNGMTVLDGWRDRAKRVLTIGMRT